MITTTSTLYDSDYQLWLENTINQLRQGDFQGVDWQNLFCLLYTSPSPRDRQKSRMPSSA